MRCYHIQIWLKTKDIAFNLYLYCGNAQQLQVSENR